MRQKTEGAIKAACLHTGAPQERGTGEVLEGSGRGGTPGLPDGVAL